MDESTVPRWQRVWAQLPREVRGQLIKLLLVCLLFGILLLMYMPRSCFLPEGCGWWSGCRSSPHPMP